MADKITCGRFYCVPGPRESRRDPAPPDCGSSRRRGTAVAASKPESDSANAGFRTYETHEVQRRIHSGASRRYHPYRNLTPGSRCLKCGSTKGPAGRCRNPMPRFCLITRYISAPTCCWVHSRAYRGIPPAGAKGCTRPARARPVQDQNCGCEESPGNLAYRPGTAYGLLGACTRGRFRRYILGSPGDLDCQLAIAE